MIFATPDFGAGATIMAFICFVWMIVLALSILGLIYGVKLCRGDKPKAKGLGIFLILLSGMVPLCCWVLPAEHTRRTYGNYPISQAQIDKIKVGMTGDEVLAILGTPHDRDGEGGGEERWYYWMDSFGIRYERVYFDPNGRVKLVYGN